MLKYLISWTVVFLAFCLFIVYMQAKEQNTSAESSTSTMVATSDLTQEDTSAHVEVNSPEPTGLTESEDKVDSNHFGTAIVPDTAFKISTNYGSINLVSLYPNGDNLILEVEVFNESEDTLKLLDLLYLDMFSGTWLDRINNTDNIYDVIINPGGKYVYRTTWKAPANTEYVRLHVGDLVSKQEYIKVIEVDNG